MQLPNPLYFVSKTKPKVNVTVTRAKFIRRLENGG